MATELSNEYDGLDMGEILAALHKANQAVKNLVARNTKLERDARDMRARIAELEAELENRQGR